MTQVTTPDNIPSPDLTDQYALTQDMANLADGTQKALIKRANFYLGTSAQRAAFTTAPEGTHWQDTNGTKFEYVRKSGAWVSLQEDTGWLPLQLTGSGTTPMTGVEAPKCRLRNGLIHFQGGITNSGLTAASVSDRLVLPSQVASLLTFPFSGAAVSSTAASTGVWIISVGGILNLRTGSPVGSYYKVDGIPPIPVR